MINGHQQEHVLRHLALWNKRLVWKAIIGMPIGEGKDVLIAYWIKFVEPDEDTQEWINKNYTFLCKYRELITFERLCVLISQSSFEAVTDEDEEILMCVIDRCSYVINSANMCCIMSFVNKPVSFEKADITLTAIRNCHKEEFTTWIEQNIGLAIEYFSTILKNESIEAIIFIVNSTEINDDSKLKYLKGQQNLLPDMSVVERQWHHILIKDLLVEPTWDVVNLYYDECSGCADELKQYIAHFTSQLGIKPFKASKERLKDFFILLLGTNILSLDKKKEIYPVFKECVFRSYDISGLDVHSLKFLLEKDMIDFNTEMVTILKDTSIYSNYLIKYHKKVMETLKDSYFNTSDVSADILSSSIFSNDDKQKILSLIPLQHITTNEKLWHIVVDLLLEDCGDVEFTRINAIITAGRGEKQSIKLATKYISEYSLEESDIDELMESLGEPYSEIKQKDKRPKFDNTQDNLCLLDVLKSEGYISSHGNEREGKVQVYHRMKNEFMTRSEAERILQRRFGVEEVL